MCVRLTCCVLVFVLVRASAPLFAGTAQAQAYSGRDGRGDMWLFFGCRHREQDWIFQEEMEGFLQKGTLSRLHTAFSRDSAKKVYVQVRDTCGVRLVRLE